MDKMRESMWKLRKEGADKLSKDQLLKLLVGAYIALDQITMYVAKKHGKKSFGKITDDEVYKRGYLFRNLITERSIEESWKLTDQVFSEDFKKMCKDLEEKNAD